MLLAQKALYDPELRRQPSGAGRQVPPNCTDFGQIIGSGLSKCSAGAGHRILAPAPLGEDVCHITEFVVDGHNDIDARTLWFYQAIVVSPNLQPTTPGVGTVYPTAALDKPGDPLDGATAYKLIVPANPLAKRFWAVTTYDPATRVLLASDRKITVGSDTKSVANDDGSVDLYFGQSASEGFENNLITTDPEKCFFVEFRFYGAHPTRTVHLVQADNRSTPLRLTPSKWD